MPVQSKQHSSVLVVSTFPLESFYRQPNLFCKKNCFKKIRKIYNKAPTMEYFSALVYNLEEKDTVLDVFYRILSFSVEQMSAIASKVYTSFLSPFVTQLYPKVLD